LQSPSDRLPYATDVNIKAGSTIPAVNDVHNNFIVANYAADGGCLDNDDGSSYYHIHHNFCVVSVDTLSIRACSAASVANVL
jgi:hypothetical protein